MAYPSRERLNFNGILFLKRNHNTGGLTRSTYLATGFLMSRVVGQMTWTIILARTLGPDGYGLLSGVTALGAMLGTVAGLGLGTVLLQETSRNNDFFHELWKHSITITFSTGSGLLVLFASLGPVLLPPHGHLSIYVAIGISELICFPLVFVSSQAFQAFDRIGWSAALLWLPTFGNLIALALFSANTLQQTLSAYLPYHAAGATLAALLALLLVWVILAPRKTTARITRRQLHEGAEFSSIRLAESALSSLDKVLVLKLIDSHTAGIYTAAFRLVSVATLPIVSLCMAALPRLFQVGGDQGHHDARPLVARLLLITVAYGALALLAVLATSSLLPILFGPQFQAAGEAARWLAPSPLLLGMYIIGANVLISHGRRTHRLIVQCVSTVSMIALASFLLPKFGLAGAVLTLLITQCISVALVWHGAIKALQDRATHTL